MNKQKIILRIRKLLSMAETKEYNLHEAENATKQAQILLNKYNLTISEIEAKEIEQLDIFFDDGDERILDWKLMLSQVMSKAHNVKSLILQNETKHIGLRFIGGALDIEVAKYTFEFLVKIINDLSNSSQENKPSDQFEHSFFNSSPTSGTFTSSSFAFDISKHIDIYSYQIGLVHSINDKLKETKTEDMVTKIENNGNNIIHIKNQALEEHIVNLNIADDKAPPKQSIDGYAFDKGILDGNKIQIKKGIN